MGKTKSLCAFYNPLSRHFVPTAPLTKGSLDRCASHINLILYTSEIESIGIGVTAMKKIISAFLCAVMLLLCCPVGAYAAGDVPMETTVSQSQESDQKEFSKGAKIAGFLVIFTISMGVTAFIIVRPKLKMLKEAREKNK